MRERSAADGGPEDEPASDPLADLLFTLIAAVLPAILFLAPLTQRTAASVHRRAVERARAGATLDGKPVSPIVAGAEGLRFGDEPRLIGLDAIADDPGLRAALGAMKRAGQPAVLLVEPDGTESAFLLDPVLAAAGPRRIVEIRLTRPCAEAQPSLSALCGAAR